MPFMYAMFERISPKRTHVQQFSHQSICVYNFFFRCFLFVTFDISFSNDSHIHTLFTYSYGHIIIQINCSDILPLFINTVERPKII